MPAIGMPRHSVAFGLLSIVLPCLLATPLSFADDLEWQSLSLRARVSEKTLLGDEAPEEFEEYDLSANVALPWEHYTTSGWGMGTRLMASAGILRGAGKNALVVSVIPELTLGSQDGRFVLDLGAGGALFSRHRFGEQDFGGPFQFALTLGVGIPLYRNLGLGYRFLHYSDAGVNGPDTTGADFHMIEFRYRY
ncbi:acyloxyacyl hydrolase [Halomonas urmiana]|nr:acyloxyacyl hydrolase [Halomonas urmiana]